jgi:hypothetical protein
MAVSPQPPKPPQLDDQNASSVQRQVAPPLPHGAIVREVNHPEPDRWVGLGPLYPLKWLFW